MRPDLVPLTARCALRIDIGALVIAASLGLLQFFGLGVLGPPNTPTDAVKAIVPILVARRLLAGAPGAEAWTVGVAVAAFLGHLFPPWLGFRGGKGVATGLGIFAVLAPWAALVAVAGYALAYGATRISSLGSLVGTTLCVVGTFVAHGAASPVSWAGLVIGALIFLRHRANIGRLLRGEEKRMKV